MSRNRQLARRATLARTDRQAARISCAPRRRDGNAKPLTESLTCTYWQREVASKGAWVERASLLARLITFIAVLVGALAHARAARAQAAEPRPYVESLVAEAERQKLAAQPMWLRLGHYRKGWFGWESEADGKQFFASEEGKGDPSAELDATLRAFFVKPSPDASVEHPICRWPARFGWLNEQLSIDVKRLPRVRCEQYDKFKTELNARSVTLIFSSYFLNNPASAFGHTFLRINKATRGDAREGRELLDYGIDYSAAVDTTNALLYAFKGLTGLFPGTFRRVPFFYKVREYNDYESRDLWEYDLNLTQPQIDRVVAHLWELGHTHFRYFYLSENCSYHILGVLEVADPKLELISRLGYPVLPADTIKVILKNPGLLRALHYRPSNRTQFKHRLQTLSPEELAAVDRLLDAPEAALDARFDPAAQARILDAAIDLVEVRFARDINKQREAMDQRGIAVEQALLERRASLDVDSEELKIPLPERGIPHLGHDSIRLGMGSGYERWGGAYHTLSARLALHDLADPARGYPDGAEISFFAFSGRYYLEHPKVTLEDFSLVRVQSLTPLSRFDRSLSWMVDAGAKRTADRGCNGCTSAFATVGGGVTLEPFGRALTFFAMAKAELGLPIDSGYWDVLRFGIGPYGGLRLQPSDDVRALFTGSWSYLPGQSPRGIYEVRGVLRAQYTRDFALGIEGRLLDRSASAQAVSYIYF